MFLVNTHLAQMNTFQLFCIQICCLKCLQALACASYFNEKGVKKPALFFLCVEMQRLLNNNFTAAAGNLVERGKSKKFAGA